MNTEALEQELQYVAIKAGKAVDEAKAGKTYEAEEALQLVFDTLNAIREIAGIEEN